MPLNTAGLRPLDTGGLRPLDATGLTPLDTSRLTPFEESAPEPATDSWASLGRKVLENAPKLFKQAAGGVAQSIVESEARSPPMGMDAFDPNSQRQYETATKNREIVEGARAAGTLPGQQMYRDATAELQANAPNVDPDSLKAYAYDITQGIIQMGPAIAVALATKSPAVGVAAMTPQVFGPQYAESREKGRSADAATADAVFNSAAEAIPEMIPLGFLMKPGSKFLVRTLKTAGAEAIQEMFTEALQAGYQAGVLDETTPWGEVPGRLARAGIVGAGVGGGLAAAAHPFVGGEQRAPAPEATTAADLSARAQSRRSELEASDSLSPAEQEEADFLSTNPSPEALATAYGVKLEVELTQQDRASPIPDDLILEGKLLVQDALSAPLALPAPTKSTVYVGREGAAGTAQQREELGITPDIERVIAARKSQETANAQVLPAPEASQEGRAQPAAPRQEEAPAIPPEGRAAQPGAVLDTTGLTALDASGPDGGPIRPDGVRRGRDEKYGVDIELRPDGKGGHVLTEQDASGKRDKVISSGTGGIYLGKDILNVDGEFVPASEIIQGSNVATASESTPFKPRPEQRQAVVDLVAEIEFQRATGNMDEVARLEDQLREVASGKRPLATPIYKEVADDSPTIPVKPLTEYPTAITADQALTPVETAKTPVYPPESPESGKTRERLDKLLERAARREAMESQGRAILDEIEESGRTTKDVSSDFWGRTYFDLTAEQQAQVRKQLTSFGFKLGDVLSVDRDGKPTKAESWEQVGRFVSEDLASEVSNLEGTERGFVSMMEYLNQSTPRLESAVAQVVPSQPKLAAPAALPPTSVPSNEDTGSATVAAALPGRDPFDARLKSDEHRYGLEALSRDLTPGGGMATITDDLGRVQSRTPSQNPAWFQNLGAEATTRLSVDQLQRAVRKALDGKLLGAREKRAVEAMLGVVDDQMAYMPTAEELKADGHEEGADAGFDVSLVARANEIDENAVEQAARQFENDDAGFLGAVKDILARPSAATPVDSEAGQRAPERDLAGAVDRGAQALADETRARDAARSPNRDVSIETGDPSDLFSKARQQGDLLAFANERGLRETAQAFRGKKLDGGWTAFSPLSGTRGIPRDDMPQIKAEHRGALANFLKARGIESVEETMPAALLRPTQAEFSEQKVVKAKNFQGGDRAILISADDYVLDGHHQWMAKLDKGEDVRVIRLDAPIRELLKVVPEFPSAEGGVPEVRENLFAEWGGRRVPVDSVEDAQAKWNAFREASEAGASEIGSARITNETGEHVGTISYNGRFFPTGKGKALPKPATTTTADVPIKDAAERLQAENLTHVVEESKAREKFQKSGAITDFGQRIEGARKDYAATLKAAESVDVAAAPLSESWPEPDYQKLLDSGADPRVVAFVHAARDEIPTKPQRSWKLKEWTKQVTQLRDFATRILGGIIPSDKVMTTLDDFQSLKSVNDRVKLYLEVGHEKSLKGVTVSAGSYSVYNGQHFDQPKIIWSVERRAPKTMMSNWPRQLGTGATREEAIADFKKRWAETSPEQDEKKAITFNIYGIKGGYGIGRKVGRKVLIVKGGFDKVKAARLYLAENQAELVKQLERAKQVPNERRPDNSPRVGIDHRNETDVTPEQFSETFGFRGVQFGNYVEGGRRQADLNETYDALMDLAGILDVPPKAMSLNGELGLAFGARGTGGTNAASAHYESDLVVINLTKKKGAGALAHEWFHALDNYFSRMGKKPAGFVTARAEAGEGVRPEMAQAFAAVRMAIQRSPMANRSRTLDRTRSKDYWSTGEELAARAFEAYVIAKQQGQGASNDYLANIVSKAYWDAETALGLEERGEETYPYPAPEEMGPLREAFDSFFDTIETRETEKGVEMFDLTPAARKKVDATVADLKARLAQVGISDRVALKLEAVIKNQEGALMSGARGRYYARTIELAMYTGQKAHTLDHEIVHALRDLGVIRDAEWNVLAAKARADELLMAKIRDKYERLNLSDDKLVEEAIADMHADWAAGKSKPQGFIRTAFERIRAFFEALRNALKGQGFQSAEDVFGRIGSGEMGKRDSRGNDAEAPAYALDKPLKFNPAAAKKARRDTAKSDKEPPSQKGDSGYTKMAQKAIDVWNKKVGWRYGALGRLPGARAYLEQRYLALGRVAAGQEIGREIYDSLAEASEQDQQRVYDYLTNADGDPSTIENADVRRAAIRAKALVDKVGKRLVDVGLLSEEAYQEHAGEYLPRLYLKHLLGERRFTAIGSGKRLSDLGYLKKRQDIPEEVRKVLLGEITDPAFLASFGLTRTLRDLALLDFLNGVAGNRKWTPPGATTEWNGRHVSPFWLSEEATQLRRRARLYKDDAQAKALKIADDMDQAVDKSLEQLGTADNMKDYEQIPDNKKYGALRGLWVRKEIYNDLVGAQNFVPRDASVAESLFGQGGVLTKATQWWKMSKVVLNPPTQVRNFLANLALLHLSGVPLRRVYSGELVGKAIKSIATKDRYYEIAKKYGLFATTFANQEGARITEEWLALQDMKGGGFAKIKAFAGRMTNVASDFYGLMEAIGKIAKLRDAMDREGKSPADAMLDAHESLFDYSLVPRSVQYLRNQPLGAPFITFMYKALGQMAKTAVKHPLRFAPYAAVPYLLAELIKNAYDVDDDDLDDLKKAFPRWMRERGHMLLLPYKDAKGRWQVADMGYLVPWGQFADLAASIKEGKGGKDLLNLVAFGGPLTDVIAAIDTNVDPFTGREIIDSRDPPADKLQSMMLYVWNLAMPGFLTQQGAIAQFKRAAMGEVNRRGEPGQTTGQAAARLFGVNVYPVDPEATKAANLRSMKYEIDDSKARKSELLRNRNLTDSERREIAETWNEIIEKRSQEYIDYNREARIHPNLRTE